MDGPPLPGGIAAPCRSFAAPGIGEGEAGLEFAAIGLDLAKNMFQADGAGGTVVLRTTLRRAERLAFFAGLPPPPISMEARGGAHRRARELAALGHEVRLMPPTCVKPYVEREGTDGEEDLGRSAAA